jgi:hypothetical protein
MITSVSDKQSVRHDKETTIKDDREHDWVDYQVVVVAIKMGRIRREGAERCWLKRPATLTGHELDVDRRRS